MEVHSKDDGWRQDQPPINFWKQLLPLGIRPQQLIKYPQQHPHRSCDPALLAGHWFGGSAARRTAQAAPAGSKHAMKSQIALMLQINAHAIVAKTASAEVAISRWIMGGL